MFHTHKHLKNQIWICFKTLLCGHPTVKNEDRAKFEYEDGARNEDQDEAKNMDQDKSKTKDYDGAKIGDQDQTKTENQDEDNKTKKNENLIGKMTWLGLHCIFTILRFTLKFTAKKVFELYSCLWIDTDI